MTRNPKIEITYWGRTRTCEVIGHTGARRRKAVGVAWVNHRRLFVLEDGKRFAARDYPTFRPLGVRGRLTWRALLNHDIADVEGRIRGLAAQHDDDMALLRAAEQATDEWAPEPGRGTTTYRERAYPTLHRVQGDEYQVGVGDGVGWSVHRLGRIRERIAARPTWLAEAKAERSQLRAWLAALEAEMAENGEVQS